MGDKNDVTKEFMSNNVFFADFCNYYIYNGEQRIQPDQLHPLDTSALLHAGKKHPSKTERDVLKYISAKTTDTVAYLIVGIENQSDIDYAMPARNMLYDAQQYHRQRQEIINAHRNNREYEYFISGMHKDDKLLPVITIVVYFGSKPWDGPMTLHEILNTDDPDLLQYVADYRLNLIDPHRLDDEALKKFHTNAREVLTFIKHAKNKSKILELVQERRFQTLDHLAADVINACTNSKLPLTANEEDDVNMCQAIDEIREDSRNEGRAEERKEMAIALLKKNIMTLAEIAELTKLSIEEVNALQQEHLQNA